MGDNRVRIATLGPDARNKLFPIADKLANNFEFFWIRGTDDKSNFTFRCPISSRPSSDVLV